MATSYPVGFGATANRPSSFSQMVTQYGLPRTLWALIVGVPHTKATKLKPTGYNAFVERITQPMLIIASVALTTGAVFVMAEGLIQEASVAIAAGHIPSFQITLSLATLFVIGFLIDTSLITAGSRFRMHALRGETGWAVLSGVMLLLCVGVEGTTWSYLLYQLEPTVLPANVASFIRGIPAVLFFVRAFMGPICLIYLTAGVLPLTLQRSDVDRQTAALAGSAIVTLVNALVHQIQDFGLVSPQQAVTLLDLFLTLFRVSAKHQTEQEDKAMVQAFRDLGDSVLSVAPVISSAIAATTQASSSPFTAEQLDQLARLVHPANEDDSDDADDREPDAPSGSAATDGPRLHIEPQLHSMKSVAPSVPKPGTKAFRDLVRKTIVAMQQASQPRTFYTIARRMGEGVQTDDVKAAFEIMRQERLNKLRPGAREATDPVLDDPALVVTSEAS